MSSSWLKRNSLNTQQLQSPTTAGAVGVPPELAGAPATTTTTSPQHHQYSFGEDDSLEAIQPMWTPSTAAVTPHNSFHRFPDEYTLSAPFSPQGASANATFGYNRQSPAANALMRRSPNVSSYGSHHSLAHSKRNSGLGEVNANTVQKTPVCITPNPSSSSAQIRTRSSSQLHLPTQPGTESKRPLSNSSSIHLHHGYNGFKESSVDVPISPLGSNNQENTKPVEERRKELAISCGLPTPSSQEEFIFDLDDA